jgi:hypothetical protein
MELGSSASGDPTITSPLPASRLIVCDHCGKRFRAHKQTRGSIPHYYMCASYHDDGLSVCDGLRIPAPYLDEVVVNGIQKRPQAVLDQDVLRGILMDQLRQHQPVEDMIGPLQEKLAGTRQQIKRLVDALHRVGTFRA